jgi:hypothetical protein
MGVRYRGNLLIALLKKARSQRISFKVNKSVQISISILTSTKTNIEKDNKRRLPTSKK